MGMIVGGAPAWVYILLVVLILLGARRLRSREVPIAVALLPAVAFLVWSVVGAVSYAAGAGAAAAALAWFGGAAVGAISTALVPEPRGVRLPGGRVALPGSWLPLVSYLGVFVLRFACGAWAAIRPEQAMLATGVSVAIGAVMTARLVLAIVRWRNAEPSPA